MSTSTPVPSRRRSTLGTVIAVFSVLVLTAVMAAVCLGIVVVRSLGMTDGTSPFREELFARLDFPCVSQVEVTVPPWLVVLGRVAASIADVDPRVNDGLAALKCGRVGVYELARGPSRREMLAMLELADQELGEAGWNRVVTVLEDEQLVAVYQSTVSGETEFDAYVIVLDDRDLVMVSAKGRVEPMTKLVAAAMEEAGLRELRF